MYICDTNIYVCMHVYIRIMPNTYVWEMKHKTQGHIAPKVELYLLYIPYFGMIYVIFVTIS